MRRGGVAEMKLLFKRLTNLCIYFMSIIIIKQFDPSNGIYILFVVSGFFWLIFSGLADMEWES